ncbi:DinB family protein [Agrococcus versicolor]|uniref:DinB family protein n=1 Tax=Agrococcus versicolor TaxID=501482 RepID=A0ABN3ALZ2_9MICO
MDEKATLLRYLQVHRDALLWKLEGLSEREARMPRTPTGTSLLGIVKHVASTEAEYLGLCFDRPWPEPMPWMDDEAEPNADMWAAADEPMAEVVDRYLRVQAHAEATVAALDLGAVGRVPWWGEQGEAVTLHRVLVHLVAEVARHAGHMDVLREGVDGAAGMRRDVSNLPGEDAVWWAEHVARLRAIAEAAPAD